VKIGITVEQPNLGSKVAERFGLSPYLLVVDSQTLSFEAIPNPGASGGAQAGIQMVILAISHGVEVLLTGYLSPVAEKHLTRNGIKVIRGVAGTAGAALKACGQDPGEHALAEGEEKKDAYQRFIPALKGALRPFAGLLPVMAGVILLIGLFKTFFMKEWIAGIFSGGILRDVFSGACLGSLLAGNPINSYLIGAGLVHRGVSLFGVTAFMAAWVSVGVIQLPAEMEALGRRFALARIGLSFCFAMAVSLFTTGLFYLMPG